MSAENVGNNDETTPPKMLGGITGKGFMPGKSGNPTGRPKKLPFTEAFERIFGNVDDAERYIRGVLESKSAMARVMIMRDGAERVEGKVTQPVELSGDVAVTVADRLTKGLERLNGGYIDTE